MDRAHFLTIDAYERLIEEFELQLLEVGVAKDHAERRRTEVKAKLANAKTFRAKQAYARHLDHYIEGISILERNQISLGTNLDYYRQRFEQFLEQ